MSHEERKGVINRMRGIKGEQPSTPIVMAMWLLNEREARSLLAEADREYGEEQ